MKTGFVKMLVLFLAVVMADGAVMAAETVHLFIKGEMQGEILGDSTQFSLGRKDSIEALAYSHMVAGEPDKELGITGTVRNHFPVVIVKRLDRSTNKLFNAWLNHESLECVIKFYRPNPTGDGTTEQFYTVILHGAYISGIHREVLNVAYPENSTLPPMERISFTYNGIEDIWIPDGSASGDKWHTNTSKPAMSDLNFDGIVNMADFAILADEWLTRF